MANDSFYDSGAGTQHPNFGTPGSESSNADSGIKQNPDYEVDKALRRVTVRQILEARQLHSSANFAIDGHEISQVMLVANIVSMDKQIYGTNYFLEDGTRGRLQALIWQVDIDEEETRKFGELSYVRVVGTVTSFNNRNKLTIRSIKEVDDPHAIYHHILRCMVDTLIYERGPPQPIECFAYTHRDIQQPVNVQVDDTLVDDILHLDLGETSTTQQSAASKSPPTQGSRPITPPVHQRGTDTGLSSAKKGKQKEGTVREDPQISGSSSAHRPTDFGLSSPNTHGEYISVASGRSSSHARSSIARSSSISCDAQECPPNNSLLFSGSTIVPQAPQERRASSPAKLRKKDPYSHLTNLERDIILSILNAGACPSLYPTEGRKTEQWEGVPVHGILTALRSRHRLSMPAFLNAIEHLVAEGYIHTTIDDGHYGVTRQVANAARR